jgi:NAD(P)-dependent dehydrogenase (short-subunit alcohol dehydrogenase family)
MQIGRSSIRPKSFRGKQMAGESMTGQRFAGKHVLVTGGARGIGAATAAAFLREGAKVAIGARSQQSYEAFVSHHVAHAGSGHLAAAIGEIGSQHLAAQVVDQALAAWGGLDILVNSAGYFAEVKVEDVDQAHWDMTMNTNVAGTFFCSHAALPALKQSHGNVVNVASDAGLIGYPLGVVYSASKAAVVNMTRAMVLELAQQIRINCVCPGNVDTDMIQQAAQASGDATGYLRTADARSPMKRMAQPSEVADAILYLASPEASFVNGAILSIDGGGVCGF